MDRRRFIGMGLGLAALVAGSGHTPYGHWKIYRRKHLMIGSCKTDAPSFPLAERIAETLLRDLPESSARASRAPDQRRVASLLASDQWQVSVLRRQDAVDLVAGLGMFEDIGAVPLNHLFAMGDHLLVCRPDFPDLHAWLVTEALTENAEGIPGGAAPKPGPIPVHAGALAYAQGDPLPAAPAAEETEANHGHSH